MQYKYYNLLIMDTDRQNNYTSYLGYLSSSGTTYRKIGLAAKYVLTFLEEADEISRRGYQRYKRAHASELSIMPGATDAILDFLSFIGVGYSRAKRKVKSLEKKEDICARNEKKVNEFVEWLDTESDASERTRETYRFAIRSFFSYADEFNQENVKRFLKTLEEQKMKPATINNRMCALVKYSKFAKKPISVKRVKTQRKLSTDNIPTEKEYQALLAYLKQKPNRDPYYWLRILATTGLRLHEFMKLSWEDVANGEVVLKGKGSKFRQVFFQKSLQQEYDDTMDAILEKEHLANLELRGAREELEIAKENYELTLRKLKKERNEAGRIHNEGKAEAKNRWAAVNEEIQSKRHNIFERYRNSGGGRPKT